MGLIDSSIDIMMSEEIEEIIVEPLSATSNTTYTAEEGHAYSPVVVNVPNSYAAADEGKVVQSGVLVAQTTLNITENDTYDTTTKNSVVVAVPAPALGTKTITQNGTYAASADDLDGYSSVTIEVVFESSSLENLTALGEEAGYVVKPKGINPTYTIRAYICARLDGSTDPDIDQGREFINNSGATYQARPYFDIIDTSTGTAILTMATKSTYNQVVDGGYLKILSWYISTSGAVTINYTWKNPSFTKQNIYTDQQGGSNITQYTTEWITGPYVITYIPSNP